MAMSVEEKAFLEKLESIVESALAQKGVVSFTPEEAELLKRVAARERAWASIGALAGSAKTVMTWFGFMIGAWMAIRSGIAEWIISLIAGTAK